jgi:predicted nucleotidyltransferase
LGGVVIKSIDEAEIVVFGSFADGTCAPGSDLDVFVVLTRWANSVWDRIPELLPGPFPLGVDLFPYTREEIAARAPSPVLDAVRRRRWRYTRTNWTPVCP